MSIEHVTCGDYLEADKKAEIDRFNAKLEESLSDEHFAIDGEGEFESMYLNDIDDDETPGVAYMHDANTPSPDEYGDMNIDEWPEDDDEEAIDKYLNVKLIMNTGTYDERCGCAVKRSWGLDGDPIGQAHANPLFDTQEYEVEFTDGTHK